MHPFVFENSSNKILKFVNRKLFDDIPRNAWRRWNSPPAHPLLDPYPWIKPKTQKIRFQPALNKSFCSTPPIIHQPTIKALQLEK